MVKRVKSRTFASKSGSVAMMCAQTNRATRKSDLQTRRDTVWEESRETKIQLEALRARIFATLKKVNKSYKRAIKRAAKRIVEQGRADMYLDTRALDSTSNQFSFMDELLDSVQGQGKGMDP